MTVLVQKEAPNELTYLDANRIEGVVDLLAKREPVSHKHDRWVAGGASSSAGGLASDTQDLEPRAEPTYQQTVVRAELTHQQTVVRTVPTHQQRVIRTESTQQQTVVRTEPTQQQTVLRA